MMKNMMKTEGLEEEFVQAMKKKIAENPSDGSEESIDEVLLSLFERGFIDVQKTEDGEFAFSITDEGTMAITNQAALFSASPAEA